MGKYTIAGDKACIKDSPWQQTHAMIFTANELAEANRLKRIEINMLTISVMKDLGMKITPDKDMQKIIDSVQEDLA